MKKSWSHGFASIRQKIRSAKRLLTEDAPFAWKEKVTGKIILQLLARQKNEEPEKKKWKWSSRFPFLQKISHPVAAFLSKICGFVRKNRVVSAALRLCVQGWSRLERLLEYPTLLFVLLLFYLILWHPGIHNRIIPETPALQSLKKRTISPRPELYPLNSVLIEIDRKPGWITLWMQQKKVASHPARIYSVEPGKYRISSFKNLQHSFVACATLAQDDSVWLVMKSEEIRLDIHDRYINIDSDLWETLYPYLRIETPVHVR